MSGRDRLRSLNRDYVEVQEVQQRLVDSGRLLTLRKFQRFLERHREVLESEPTALLPAAHGQPQDCPVRRDAERLSLASSGSPGSRLVLLNPQRTDPAPELIRSFNDWDSEKPPTPGDRSLSVDPQGFFGLTCGGNASVRVWDLRRMEPLPPLLGHEGTALAVATAAGIAVSGGDDNRLIRWNLRDRVATELLRPLGPNASTTTAHDLMISAVAISYNGQKAISGGNDGVARVWDLTRGRLEKELAGHQGYVTTVCLSPSGEQAVTGSRDGLGRYWDCSPTAKDQPIATFDHSGWVNALAVEWGRGIVATGGGSDGVVRLWNLQDGRPLGQTPPLGSSVVSLAFDPKQKRLAIGTEGESGRYLCVWRYPSTSRADRSSVADLTWLVSPRSSIRALAIHPQGRIALTCDDESNLNMLDLDYPVDPESAALAETKLDTVCLGYSSDGSRLMTGHRDGRVLVRNGDGQEAPLLEQTHGDEVVAVALSATGRQAVSASRNSQVLLWIVDQDDAGVFDVLSAGGSLVRSLSLSGWRALIFRDSGKAEVWRLGHDRKYRVFPPEKGWRDENRLLAAALDATGGEVLAASSDGLISWPIQQSTNATPDLNRKLSIPDGVPIQWSRDGRFAVFSDPPALIDRQDPSRVLVLREHPGQVLALAVDSRADHIFTGASDGCLRVWDGRTGKLTVPPFPTGSPITALAVADSNPTRVACCNRRGRLFVFELNR